MGNITDFKKFKHKRESEKEKSRQAEKASQEFDDADTYEQHVDLKFERQEHELRNLRDWCKDQDMKLRQLAMFCEDLTRDYNELSAKYTRLIKALAASTKIKD